MELLKKISSYLIIGCLILGYIYVRIKYGRTIYPFIFLGIIILGFIVIPLIFYILTRFKLIKNDSFVHKIGDQINELIETIFNLH